MTGFEWSQWCDANPWWNILWPWVRYLESYFYFYTPECFFLYSIYFFSLLYWAFWTFFHMFVFLLLASITPALAWLLLHLQLYHYFLLVFFSSLILVFTGTGKVVMAATVLHPFSECTGIEILNGLHCVAVELLSCFQDKVLPKMAKRERNTRDRKSVV